MKLDARSLLAVGLLCVRGAASTAQAEPDRVTNWLMEEPVSLLDWGTFRLTQQFQGLRTKDGVQFSASASYDWTENRLRVALLCLIPKAEDREQASAWAREGIDYVRAMLGVDPDTGRRVEAPSVLALLFSHDGFRRGAQPSDLGSRLEEILTIEARVLYRTQDGVDVLTAAAKLLDTGMLIKEAARDDG